MVHPNKIKGTEHRKFDRREYLGNAIHGTVEFLHLAVEQGEYPVGMSTPSRAFPSST